MTRLLLRSRWVYGIWISVCMMTMQVKSGRQSADCPARCLCNGTNVQCVQPVFLPVKWPPRTESIELIYKKKPRNGLVPGAFSHLQGIKAISIRGKIGTVHTSAFYDLKGVPTMSAITFIDCTIDSVQVSAFNRIKNFDITISASQISSFKTGSFNSVYSFNRFNISATSIGEIGERVFVGVSEVDSFTLSQSSIEVIYNYAFTGIRDVRLFSTRGLKVTMCMGRFSFVGMINVQSVDFSDANFPIAPLLQSTSNVDNDILTCENGWRIPESSVWFYRYRKAVIAVICIFFTCLGLASLILCYVRCRRRNSEGQLEVLVWVCSRWMRCTSRGDGRERGQQDYEMDSHRCSLPTYEDCMGQGMQTGYPVVTEARLTPPPPYPVQPSVVDRESPHTDNGMYVVSEDYVQNTYSHHVDPGDTEDSSV